MQENSALVRSSSRAVDAVQKVRRKLEWLRRPSVDIAESLMRLRRLRGLSQAELAERIGTKQPAIARLESGVANPRLKTLVVLARALDATVRVEMAPAERIDDGFRVHQWWSLPDASTAAVQIDNAYYVRAELENCPRGTFVLSNRPTTLGLSAGRFPLLAMDGSPQELHDGVVYLDEVAPTSVEGQ